MASKTTNPKIKNTTPTTTTPPSTTTNEYFSLYFLEIKTTILFTYLYLFSSIMLNLINRVLYREYNFKFNFTLILVQQITAIICFQVIFTRLENYKEKVGQISIEEFLNKKFFIFSFSILFIMNILSSFLGNQLVNTQMFLCLRKFLLIMNYLFDLYWNKKTLPNYFTASVLLIVFGSFISGYEDLTSELIGYFIVFVNNLLSVLFGQMQEKSRKEYSLPPVKILIYNSYIVIPICIVLVFVTGEFSKLKDYYYSDNNFLTLGFCFYLGISCLMTVVLNASYFISNEINSSLFTQLCANCKDIFITFAGFFMLKDFAMNWNTIFGMICSTLGASIFSMKTIIESIRSRNKKYNK